MVDFAQQQNGRNLYTETSDRVFVQTVIDAKKWDNEIRFEHTMVLFLYLKNFLVFASSDDVKGEWILSIFFISTPFRHEKNSVKMLLMERFS